MEINVMHIREEYLIGISSRAIGTTAIEPKMVFEKNYYTAAFDMSACYTALIQEFPFLNHHMSLSNTEIVSLEGLFQWVVEQLIDTSFSSPSVPLSHVLLVAANLDSRGVQLWQELSAVGALQSVRLDEIKELIVSRKIDFSELKKLTIRNRIESFEEACNRRDWEGIDRVLHEVSIFLSDALLSSAARALYIFAPSELHAVLNDIHDIASLMTVIEALTPLADLNVLQIASDSANWSLKFCTFRLSLQLKDSIARSRLEDLWVKILCQASQDVEQWHQWMAVFKAASSQFPMLNRAMGRALCAMPENAIAHYFDVIDISIYGQMDRWLDTFECVESHDEESRRKKIWTYAFQRWQKWSYDNKHDLQYLRSIQQSPIDLAVAAYYRECLDAEERGAHEDSLYEEFLEIQRAWYESWSKHSIELNQHLSRYQPLGYAQQVHIANAQFARGEIKYQPKWMPSNLYWAIRVPM